MRTRRAPSGRIDKAVAEGKLSFAFLDSPQYAWAGYSTKTYRQACEELGLSMDAVRGVHESLGLAPPVPEDPVREDDLELLPPAHVGLHAGPVVQQDGDYYGRTVNVAARIAGRAEPNEVLVSEDVRQASPAGGVRFDDVGLVELKNVSRPVRLYRASRA